MIEIIIQLCPEIMVCGWWSKDEDVVWYAIWRDRHQERLIDAYLSRAVCSRADLVDPLATPDDGNQMARYLIKPLGEGELFALEAEQAVCTGRAGYSVRCIIADSQALVLLCIQAYERQLAEHTKSLHARVTSSPESRITV